jgi:hypothetical protein
MNNGQLTIYAPAVAAPIDKIELMDITGRTLRASTLHLSLDIRGLPVQAYLLAVYHRKAMRPMVQRVVLGD